MDRRTVSGRGLAASLEALASPLSLVAIGVLLLNDHVLKALWPSALTGKVSDFAGLFFTPYVVLAAAFALSAGLLRGRTRALGVCSYVSVAAVFAALKLSATTAEPLLSLSSAIGFPVVIVPDLSDLIALSILPLSYARWWRLVHVTSPARQRPPRLIALAVAAMSIVATSGPPQPSVTSLVAHPGDDSVRVTVEYTNSSDGVYVGDGGVSWARTARAAGELIADPRQAGAVYLVHDEVWARSLELLAPDGRLQAVGLPSPGPRPRVVTVHGPTMLAVAPWDPQVLFFARNGGLLRSVNAGATWEDIGAPGEVQDIAASSENGLLYVLTTTSLYRSRDAGERWTFMSTVSSGSLGSPGRLAVHPRDPQLVLIGSRKELQRSTDGGTVLTTVHTDSGPGSGDLAAWLIRFDPSDDDHVYALFGLGCCSLLESGDRGLSWSSAGIAATDIAIDSRGNAYAVGSVRSKVFRRATGGSDWVDITGSLPITRAR